MHFKLKPPRRELFKKETDRPSAYLFERFLLFELNKLKIVSLLN